MMNDTLFSPDRKYRYFLSRELRSLPFNETKTVNFCMLNPSTADEVKNDPTVERCERRAIAMGFTRLIITNLFGWRATDASQIRKVSDPVGGGNDFAICNAVELSDLVICAWGNNGCFLDRGERVIRLILSRQATPHYLRLTKTGQPEHPLYIPYSIHPKPWGKS